MLWACRAGDVGTRSYGGAMPIGMVTYALVRAYYAINGAAPATGGGDTEAPNGGGLIFFSYKVYGAPM